VSQVSLQRSYESAGNGPVMQSAYAISLVASPARIPFGAPPARR